MASDGNADDDRNFKEFNAIQFVSQVPYNQKAINF